MVERRGYMRAQTLQEVPCFVKRQLKRVSAIVGVAVKSGDENDGLVRFVNAQSILQRHNPFWNISGFGILWRLCR
jgi:hypothetical protein